MMAEALSTPLSFTLTGSEQADITQAQPFLQTIETPQAVIADKTRYDKFAEHFAAFAILALSVFGWLNVNRP